MRLEKYKKLQVLLLVKTSMSFGCVLANKHWIIRIRTSKQHLYSILECI